MCDLARWPRSHGATGEQPDTQALVARNSAGSVCFIVFIIYRLCLVILAPGFPLATVLPALEAPWLLPAGNPAGHDE